IHYLRDIEDALALRRQLERGGRLLVIGAGFIGLEGAAAARKLGCEVTVLELAARPLARVAAPEIGELFADLHRKQGVELRAGVSATAIDATEDGVRVTTSEGDEIAGAALLIGIGAIPNQELAAAGGLAVEDGILVDEFGRTADPAIFAAGDN